MIKLNLPEENDIDRSSGTAVLEQEPQIKYKIKDEFWGDKNEKTIQNKIRKKDKF